MMTALRHGERHVLGSLVDDDRRFITLDTLYGELNEVVTVAQIQHALKSLRALGFVTGTGSYCATALGTEALRESREKDAKIEQDLQAALRGLPSS